MKFLYIFSCAIIFLPLVNCSKEQYRKISASSYYESSDKADLISEYNEMVSNITTYGNFFNRSYSSPRLQELSLAQDREDLWLWENFFFGVKVGHLLTSRLLDYYY